MDSRTTVVHQHDREEELTELREQFNDVFSLRKPKDAKAGLSSGAKSIGKGVLAGAVGLFAAPIVMAKEEGAKGFAKGVAVGVLGAAVLPVVGVGVGVTQMVRGVANTPEAIKESRSGKHWDKESRVWVAQPGSALVLDDESFAPVRQQWQRSGGGASSSGGGGGGHSTEYYDLLGVARDASPEAIKRAYYVAARRAHPDKNPDDPSAKARFQRLGEAYQVLCNAELRAKYDAHGAEALNVDFMDSSEFFTALFGSDRFEHLVGELMIASAAKSGGDLNPAQMRKLQAARQERLVVMLAALLRRYVEGDQEGFREAMSAEADSLARTTFGVIMLQTIGRCYISQADIQLGNIFEGSFAAMKSKGHSLRSQMRAASLAVKVYHAQQQIEKLEREHAMHTNAASSSSTSGAPQEQQQPAEAHQQQEQQQQQQQHQHQHQQQQRQQQPVPHEDRSGSTSTFPAAAAGQGQDAEAAPADPAAAAADAQSQAHDRARALAELAAQRAALEEAALPLMLDAMWAANTLDIQHTVKAVCQEVLRGSKAPKEVRRARALALKELGGMFLDAAAAQQEVTPPAQGDKTDAKKKFEDAMQRMIDKRNAADDATYGGASAPI